MIRLWLSRGTSIPLREQLSAQLILGVLSRRLAPGERLPSVRELARRLNLHANTISAAYQDLAKRGWVSMRRGSGVFVRNVHTPEQNNRLDVFVAACVEEGLARGFSLQALQSAFRNITLKSQASEFLVVDPDPEFARILAAEIGEATGVVWPHSGSGNAPPKLNPNTCVLMNQAHVAQLSRWFVETSIRPIQLKSMQDILAGHQRPASAVLIAIVSRSDSILSWASTLLSALGFAADSVLLRNPRVADWQDGLGACHIVAADVVVAQELPTQAKLVVFRVVSEEFLADMRRLVTEQKLS